MDTCTWKMLDRITGQIKSGQSVVKGSFNWLENNWSCDHNRAIEFYKDGSVIADSCRMMPDETQRFILLELKNDSDGIIEFAGQDPEYT
jgi:hypothetical protein